MKDIGLIIYLIIIIVGIVNSLLRKKNNANKPKPQPRPNKPVVKSQPHEQPKAFGEELRKILSTFIDEESDLIEKKREEHQTQRIDSAFSESLKLRKEHNEELDFYKQEQPNLALKMELSEDQNGNTFDLEPSVRINIEEEDWQKAVILSEIFNEPRFKRY